MKFVVILRMVSLKKRYLIIYNLVKKTSFLDELGYGPLDHNLHLDSTRRPVHMEVDGIFSS